MKEYSPILPRTQNSKNSKPSRKTYPKNLRILFHTVISLLQLKNLNQTAKQDLPAKSAENRDRQGIMAYPCHRGQDLLNDRIDDQYRNAEYHIYG